MFDLFRRKDTTVRYVLGFLLAMVAFSLVITLVPGFGSGGFGSGGGDDTVAKVCGDTITSKEVRLKMQQMLNKQNLPPESAAIFIPQFVDQYVAVKGVACYAGEAGLIASDKDVALKIQKDVPALWQEGKFVGRQMYEGMLRQSGLTVEQFEDSMKKDIETTRLRTLILMSAVATPKEVEDAFRETEEKIKLEYTVLDPNEINKTINLKDAEVQAVFDKDKKNYTQAASRMVSLYFDEGSKVQSMTEVSDDELKRAYADNIDSFRMPERSHVRHILFKTKEKPEAEDAKMKALAESTLKQLKGGAKFEDLAKKYSEDPGSGQNGGDIGFITRGQTVKNFDDYSFTGPLKQISNPIKTEFGYHVIEVLERQAAGQRSFDEVKGQLIAEVKRAKGTEGLGRTADQLRAELQKNPAGATALSAKLGITPMKFEYKAPDTQIPGLGPKAEIFEAVRNLKKGEASAPLTIGTDRMVVAVVDDLIPARPSTFAEARQIIMANMIVAAGQKKTQELKVRGEELVKSTGGDIAKIAKELGSPLKQTQEFNRQGFADGIGPASSVIEAFNKPVGGVIGPVTVDGKWFFGKVTDKKAADMSLLPARRAELVNMVKNKKASERADIFEETLVKRMISDRQITINDAAKKRIAASFGG